MTFCSEFASKGLNGSLAGNAVWTSVDCSEIGASDFHERICCFDVIINCRLVFNSLRSFSRRVVSIVGFVIIPKEWVAGKLGRGVVSISRNGLVGFLNCNDPLSGDEPATE